MVDHGGAGVLWAGAVSQRAAWGHPAGTQDQCHVGVGVQ